MGAQARSPRRSTDAALLIMKQFGGIMRTKEALKAGIHPRSLYLLRDQGVVEQVSRGVYRLADLPPVSNPDLVTVSLRVPRAVICLVSALSFHELTTQVPHAVAIALARGSEKPILDYPPLSVHRFSQASYETGLQVKEIDGVPIRVYGPEKTIADCFKFRNRLGMDVVLEAIKLYKARKTIRVDELMRYARICRVESSLTPYLEAIL